MSSQRTHAEDTEDDDEELVVPRKIKDPVHDLITASDRLCQFIDTPQFQRLREIKQLGTSYYVWPGASHNRFEHSLGVAHLARVLASKLQRRQPELQITDRDVECVEIAGLCHDLGHGPWSHVWDSMFIPTVMPESKWKHEDASVMMLDHLIKANNIQILPADTIFIKALISGERYTCPTEKQFLFDIVANKTNGLDVDKFDYFIRDTRMVGLGEMHSNTVTRLIDSARVIDDQICFNIKDVENVYDIYHTRFNLHKNIYNHKTGKAIEYMIIDALLEAEPVLDIASRIRDPERFTNLNDGILRTIDSSDDPRLAKARAIIHRIHTRDLYKAVDWKLVKWTERDEFARQITAAHIVEEAVRIHPSIAGQLTKDDVIVSMSTMHWGMHDQNPTQNVMFYSNKRKNECARAEEGDHSSLMPAIFAEVMLRVYSKRPEFVVHVQDGYNALLPRIRRLSQTLEASSSMSSIASVSETKPVSRNPFTQQSTPRRKRSETGAAEGSPPKKRTRT